MRSLHYQRYLNRYISFDETLWNISSACAAKGESYIITGPCGNLFCEYQNMAWDSSVLGVPTARINNIFYNKKPLAGEIEKLAVSIDSVLRSRGIKFAYIRFDLSNFILFNTLEKHGWYTSDILNLYGSHADDITDFDGHKDSFLTIRCPNLEESLSFFDRVQDLFLHARIHRDKNFSASIARRFYRELFTYIFNKPLSIKIAIYRNNKLIGVAIGEQDDTLFNSAGFKLGYLWEIGLDPEHRNHGYSSILFKKFLKSMHNHVNFIEIGTQADNIAANRLYVANNFKLVASAVTLHKWIN